MSGNKVLMKIYRLKKDALCKQFKTLHSAKICDLYMSDREGEINE
jgi:hypothetical protein